MKPRLTLLIALLFSALALPVAAGDGHDHGDAPPAASGNGPRRLPDGSEIELSDVPGLFEADGETHAELARAEAARSHAIVFVADGDLTRSQDAELRALAGYGRPLLLALRQREAQPQSTPHQHRSRS